MYADLPLLYFTRSYATKSVRQTNANTHTHSHLYAHLLSLNMAKNESHANTQKEKKLFYYWIGTNIFHMCYTLVSVCVRSKERKKEQKYDSLKKELYPFSIKTYISARK